MHVPAPLQARMHDVLLFAHMPQAFCATVIFPFSILKRLAFVPARAIFIVSSRKLRPDRYFIEVLRRSDVNAD
jgi:hypothetical protein